MKMNSCSLILIMIMTLGKGKEGDVLTNAIHKDDAKVACKIRIVGLNL